MQNNLYWISAVVFVLLLTIIFVNDYLRNKTPNKVEKSFRVMLLWVILFCLQDCLWGICESRIIKSETVFFISSSIFHISCVVTTFYWLYFILTYLSDKIRHKKLILILDLLVIVFELVIVVINFFNKGILFSIKDGNYITGILRPLTFLNQYIVYFIIGFTTLINALKNKTKDKEKFFSVFLFSLAPILTGIFQLLYPDGPFYSLGYFLGCFVIHIFVVAKEMEINSRNKILTPLADIYYSMHIIDFKTDSVEKVLESSMISEIVKGISSAKEMVDIAIKGTACPEHVEMVMEFVNLDTLAERMCDKTHISCEFVGRNFGWTRISFISVEKENGKLRKVMLTSQIIDEEKKEEIRLLFQSNNDELTGLYNRHSYETEIAKISEEGIPEDIVYISADLNGLKTANDTFGHNAGDEMLRGAAACMKKCFGLYGKVFRIGGDEFCAILNLEKGKLEEVKNIFDDAVISWKGKLIDNISVSCGYVTKNEMEDSATINDIVTFADKKMYQDKSNYYKKMGVDRRGQKDAHTALCALYTKILKINLTDDSYQIVDMDVREQSKELGFEKSISAWLHRFGKSGQVHPEDLDEYLSKTDSSFLKDYFSQGKKSLSILYRRKIENEFKHVVMDMIPANDYSLENQSLFLYVKSLD